MPLWLQNLLVLIAVIACVFAVSRQALATFRGKKSNLGNCCARGCQTPEQPKTPTTGTAFIPSESLRLRRR